MTETPYEKAVRLHYKRPPCPGGKPKRPCKRCKILVRCQHGRQFCGGCSRNDDSRRRWRKGQRKEWL